MRPESVEVKEGEDVFLECAVDHQQGKAQWTKDGFALGELVALLIIPLLVTFEI